MEDKFEKHIKGTMNNPPELPFEEKLWKDMESRLDDGRSKPRAFILPWWPFALLALLSTMAAVYFYSKVQQVNPLLSQTSSNKEQKILIDTIVEKRVTVIYDTIYNQVVINKFTTETKSKNNTANNELLAAFNFNPTPFHSQTNKISPYQFSLNKAYNNYLSAQQNDKLTSSNPGATGTSGNEISNSSDPSNASANNTLTSLAQLTNLPYWDLNSLAHNWDIRTSPLTFDESLLKKKNNFHVLQLMPTGFTLSGNIGTYLDLNFLGSPKKLILGFRGQIHYGNQFSLIIGANFLKNGFKEDLDSPDDLNKYPPVDGRDPSDPLKEIYGDFNYLQIPFGFQYQFKTKGRWQPGFGLGLISQKAIRSRLRYEFAGIREEYIEERNNLLSKAFELNAVWGEINLRYRLANSWHLQGALSTQFKLNESNYDFEDIKLLGLRLGVGYSF